MTSFLQPSDTFVHRHIGPSDEQIKSMLATIGVASLDALIEETLPGPIRKLAPMVLGYSQADRLVGEHELLESLREMMRQNKAMRSLMGLGYHGCITPGVILRNILENPGWYTQYTPYQAEISQGRLEALLNFQTMIADLTGLGLANASMLDEATAAAEAMHMCMGLVSDRDGFFVSQRCHPQTIAVVQTRAEALGVELVVGDEFAIDGAALAAYAGVLLSYPASRGQVVNYASLTQQLHAAGCMVVVACDLLALTVLRAPGDFGADIAVGVAQRFGVPLGYGGPHAGFLATKEEHKRLLPGRLIGVSRDAAGHSALRMAMQTREQHIRREKATSNICTAQVLLAVIAGMYGVYHGPDGLETIARRVVGLTRTLAAGLTALGYRLAHDTYFDTIELNLETAPYRLAELRERGLAARFNFREVDEQHLCITLDERSTLDEVDRLLSVFAPAGTKSQKAQILAAGIDAVFSAELARATAFMTHEVFHRHRSEHEMLRYIHALAAKDLSLTTSMIPLGSCTMKLNGTTEMIPVTWPEVGDIHPFAPLDQCEGYTALFAMLERWLCDITGFAAVSLQPNAGSQGEYAGLLVIRAYHRARGDLARNVCLIPVSAHGTNPASAAMAGMKVVIVACDANGNIDVGDLEAKAREHAADLSALMITYPSTHGVFEAEVKHICEIVHAHGGQVYMDGANMNAQVGLCSPGEIGADVCHLNLHKTFCIPHGGGGPGMGPIGVAKHLAPFLPGHPLIATGGEQAIGPVSAAPWGSASILPISWVYIALMGADGLTKATQVAIASANYMAKRLAGAYPLLYAGAKGRVAHEFILDLRPFKTSAGVEAEDVAKRLMDFGFHAPTMSFPVAGTLMIEPTESESKPELDRFCDAMLAIREEIAAIERGEIDRKNNPLKNAPHPASQVVSDTWDRPYSREQAAYPLPWVRANKFWPSIARIDNVYGDRNLICSCPPPEDWR